MTTTERCPKRMHYGPCGGVREDLTCEMAPIPCPFAQLGQAIDWTGPEPPGSAAPSGPGPEQRPGVLLLGRPFVLTDFSVTPFDPASITAVAAALDGSCDGVLAGEHHNRPDFPPTLLAALIRAAGASAWITLTCRDRNRVVLEQELAGLAAAGAAGVLCVTGDGRAQGVRPDVTQVFDIDGTQLAGLAARTRLPVAVAESPDAAPRALRPGRVLAKQHAGARVCVLNHAGSAARVAGFVRAARAVGVTIPFVASVAVYTDQRSAAVLELPGLRLDPAAVASVLGAADPVAAGIAAAVDEARTLLAVDGVEGVNLSGMASDRGEVYAAQIKAEAGRQIRAHAAAEPSAGEGVPT